MSRLFTNFQFVLWYFLLHTFRVTAYRHFTPLRPLGDVAIVTTSSHYNTGNYSFTHARCQTHTEPPSCKCRPLYEIARGSMVYAQHIQREVLLRWCCVTLCSELLRIKHEITTVMRKYRYILLNDQVTRRVGKNTVAWRPISRQRPQHIRGQQYRSSVFCGPRMDRCYVTHAKDMLAHGGRHTTIERLYFLLWFVPSYWRTTEEVFSMWSAPCIPTRNMFSTGSDPSLYNESLLGE
jgi:hypothetical protein